MDLVLLFSRHNRGTRPLVNLNQLEDGSMWRCWKSHFPGTVKALKLPTSFANKNRLSPVLLTLVDLFGSGCHCWFPKTLQGVPLQTACNAPSPISDRLGSLHLQYKTSIAFAHIFACVSDLIFQRQILCKGLHVEPHWGRFNADSMQIVLSERTSWYSLTTSSILAAQQLSTSFIHQKPHSTSRKTPVNNQ